MTDRTLPSETAAKQPLTVAAHDRAHRTARYAVDFGASQIPAPDAIELATAYLQLTTEHQRNAAQLAACSEGGAEVGPLADNLLAGEASRMAVQALRAVAADPVTGWAISTWLRNVADHVEAGIAIEDAIVLQNKLDRRSE